MMVKSSVLLMSVFALGLTLGSGVEAGKNDQEGPMDKFVIRTLAFSRSQENKNKRQRSVHMLLQAVTIVRMTKS
ncbi:MAG: hypothetical protein HYX35_05945 [Proteobacteria bacterium]|nr:hypothetical protein [Pseudomonadota bacterium]